MDNGVQGVFLGKCKWLLNMVIFHRNSGFTHWKWWFAIVIKHDTLQFHQKGWLENTRFIGGFPVGTQFRADFQLPRLMTIYPTEGWIIFFLLKFKVDGCWRLLLRQSRSRNKTRTLWGDEVTFSLLTESRTATTPVAVVDFPIVLVLTRYLAMAQNYQPPKWMVFLLNMIISVGHWYPNFEP